jgi:O-antigen ligase
VLPAAENIQIIIPFVSIILLLLSFRRTIFGVIGYFIILNAKLGEMYPVLGALRFELVAAIVVFVSILFSGKGWRNALPGASSLNKPFWMLFAVGMLSFVFALDHQESWTIGGYAFFKVALFYIMVVSAIRDVDDLNKMIWAFILVTAWLSYEPVANYISGAAGQYGYGEVASGKYGVAAGHVGLANTLSQVLPTAVFLIPFTRTNYKKALLIACIVLITLGVIFTKSRGGFLGLATIALGMVYIRKAQGKSLLPVIILFFIVIAAAGPRYISHMSTITEGIHGSRSSYDRYLGLVNGISMMLKRPILGVGVGCYAEARHQYFRYYFFAHNLYGELFGELGLASVFWFYWVYAVFRKAKRLKENLDTSENRQKFYHSMLTAVQLSIFVRLVIGNFTHGWYIWFWFLMAAFVVAIENGMRSEGMLES